jgi:hypothetical protein
MKLPPHILPSSLTYFMHEMLLHIRENRANIREEETKEMEREKEREREREREREE